MSNKFKIIILLFFSCCTIIGFMIRLPRLFHHYDKALHAFFYFFAVLIVTWMFPKKWISVSVGMILFGILIEYAQEFSNKISLRLIGKPIHGRFDKEDVMFNFIGLSLGLGLFLLTRVFISLRNLLTKK